MVNLTTPFVALGKLHCTLFSLRSH